MEDKVYTGTDDNQLYGVQADNRPTTIREKLDKLFKPSDFVRVKNIDSDNFTWQALDPADETYNIEPGPQKTTHRGLPKLYTIKAGTEMVLQGWNAQIMIEALYKRITANQILVTKKEREKLEGKKLDIPINWGDNEKQNLYIKQIFLGVETPSFGQPTATPTGKAAFEKANPLKAEELLSATDLAKELELDVPSKKD